MKEQQPDQKAVIPVLACGGYKRNKVKEAANQRARMKRWKEANPELHQQRLKELREYAKAYREKNRAMINAKKREASKAALAEASGDPAKLSALRKHRRELANKWRDKLKGIDSDQPIALRKLKGFTAATAAKRRAHKNRWFRDYRARNPAFKLSQAFRNRINDALRGRYKSVKLHRSLELLGCTPEFLVSYLEKMFQPGMSWDNHGHGIGNWSIDHIKPCASFNLNDPEEQKKCFHYTNLQPMWFTENCSKNSQYDGAFHRHKHLPLPP